MKRSLFQALGSAVLTLGLFFTAPVWAQPDTIVYEDTNPGMLQDIYAYPKLALAEVFSRKSHGPAGAFYLPILPDGSTVEPRSGGANGAFEVVFRFSGTVNTAIATLTEGGAGVNATTTFSGREVTVRLTNVPDGGQMRITLTVNDVPNAASANIGFLLGDVDGSRLVNQTDVTGVRTHVGATLSEANFIYDLDLSGVINQSDVTSVRTAVGNGFNGGQPGQTTFTVTPSVSGGGGTISPSTPVSVNSGGATAFTLRANAGYTISGVGGTCGGTLSGTTYTTNAITANCTVVATFVSAQQPPPNDIVGRWHYDDGFALRAVYFFDGDGTFFYASLYNFFNSFNGTYTLMVEHFRGKYQEKGAKIEATDLQRYQNDINTSAADKGAAIAADITRIIASGSRNEVLALLNPNHAYYKANDNDWVKMDARSRDLVFTDANKIKTNLIGDNNTFERKK